MASVEEPGVGLPVVGGPETMHRTIKFGMFLPRNQDETRHRGHGRGTDRCHRVTSQPFTYGILLVGP